MCHFINWFWTAYKNNTQINVFFFGGSLIWKWCIVIDIAKGISDSVCDNWHRISKSPEGVPNIKFAYSTPEQTIQSLSLISVLNILVAYLIRIHRGTLNKLVITEKYPMSNIWTKGLGNVRKNVFVVNVVGLFYV